MMMVVVVVTVIEHANCLSRHSTTRTHTRAHTQSHLHTELTIHVNTALKSMIHSKYHSGHVQIKLTCVLISIHRAIVTNISARNNNRNCKREHSFAYSFFGI